MNDYADKESKSQRQLHPVLPVTKDEVLKEHKVKDTYNRNRF